MAKKDLTMSSVLAIPKRVGGQETQKSGWNFCIWDKTKIIEWSKGEYENEEESSTF